MGFGKCRQSAVKREGTNYRPCMIIYPIQISIYQTKQSVYVWISKKIGQVQLNRKV